MYSGILQYLQNIGSLILGFVILFIVFKMLNGISKELDHQQEMDHVPNERKF